MIRNIISIPSVSEFKFLNENLVVMTDSGISSLEANTSIQGDFFCVRNYQKLLLTQSKKEDNILVLDNSLKILKEISGASNYALWLLNSCGLIPVGDRVFRLTDSLELDETAISIFPKDCIGSYGIRRAKNSVLCDDLVDGQLKWKFELGNDVKVGGDFILMSDLIIVSTTNQDLIGIEINTGKELWRLPNCNLHHQQQPKTNYLVGLASNSFGDNFYQVIDPISGKKLIDKKFDNFFYETRPTLACIKETHYYFISNVIGDGTGTKSERQTHLGCINLQTHEIEWVEKIGTTLDRRSEYQKPEINGSKIYLLDGEQTLHIYEMN